MYNTSFLLENGKELYPGYLDAKQRLIIKEQYEGKREYMRCGCKPSENLFYRISENLRIYPEHNNYKHDIYCCRYKDDSGNASRQTAYIVNQEDGEVTAYTSFDPKIFSTNEKKDSVQDNLVPEEESDELIEEVMIEKSDDIPEIKERKEPALSLEGLIRSINVDSFTEKILNNCIIESKEKFSVLVYYRMKKVTLARTKKSIGDLSLESDGVRFMYAPLAGAVKKKDNGSCYLQTKGKDGKLFNNFVYPEVVEKALKKFAKTYGIVPNETTVMAGFQYLKKTNNDKPDRVMGRVHLFQVSDYGLYCRNMVEVNAFNKLHKIVNDNSNIRFWIPPEDENMGAIIEIKGKTKKILLIFHSKKSRYVSYDSSLYVPFIVDSNTEITPETLYKLLDEN